MHTTTFEGCEDWPIDDDIVEFVVDGVRFDLHNRADLVEFALNRHNAMRLTFNASPVIFDKEAIPQVLDVEFTGVADLDLRFSLTNDRQPDLFESFEYDGINAFRIIADLVEASFTANRVSIETRTPDDRED